MNWYLIWHRHSVGCCWQQLSVITDTICSTSLVLLPHRRHRINRQVMLVAGKDRRCNNVIGHNHYPHRYSVRLGRNQERESINHCARSAEPEMSNRPIHPTETAVPEAHWENDLAHV